MNEPKSVYDYLEYREFLKDRYAYLKSTDKKYSQRYFMQKLGVKSTGFFAELLSGKRNLNRQNILSFIKILKLDHDEAGYFENLVYFNQSRSIQDKDHWLLKMMESSKVNSKILNRDVYEYFSKWYFAAIRELLFFCKKAIKPQEIADRLCPPISGDEAEKALALLERLALIERMPDGSFRQKDTVISTGDLIHSVEIANYQLQTIELAKQALDAISIAQRDISTLTMSISKDAFEKIVDILKKTKQDIIKVTQQDCDEDRVYQLNMQFFPLTNIKS
jgi:uncharacterized protein (TIGR02147 family)